MDRRITRTDMAILRAARRSRSARFSDLMRGTDLTSDTFKLYLRKLTKLGYVAKTEDGAYALTPDGKEFANRLDSDGRTVRRQPKLSVMIVAARQSADSETLYMFHQRLRNPFWGTWGLLCGPILWGEAPDVAAARELEKQTGLTASFNVAGFLRKQDLNETGELLEDKQFIIVTAADIAGEPDTSWDGGTTEWMSVHALEATGSYFTDTMSVFEMLERDETYRLIKSVHAPGEY